MISCKDFISHLGSYLEDDVAAELRQALEYHLDACPACSVIVDPSKKTVTIVTGIGHVDRVVTIPDRIVSQIMGQVRAARTRVP